MSMDADLATLRALREKNRELRASLEAAEAEATRLREALDALHESRARDIVTYTQAAEARCAELEEENADLLNRLEISGELRKQEEARCARLQQALTDARDMLWPDMVVVTGPKKQADLWQRIVSLIGPPAEFHDGNPCDPMGEYPECGMGNCPSCKPAREALAGPDTPAEYVYGMSTAVPPEVRWDTPADSQPEPKAYLCNECRASVAYEGHLPDDCLGCGSPRITDLADSQPEGPT